MNKTLMWLVGAVVGVFILLLVIGTIALKGYEKDVEMLKEQKKKNEEVSGLNKGAVVYGKGEGTLHQVTEGVTLWVGNIKTGRTEGVTGLMLAVKNETGTPYLLDKKYMYIVDEKGEQYPPKDLSGEEGTKTIKVGKYALHETEEVFLIPKGYEGDYEGWEFVYEEGDSEIREQLGQNR